MMNARTYAVLLFRVTCTVVLSCMVVVTPLVHAAEKPQAIADKTFVAWVSPASLQQQGSGVVSIMNGKQFDAIVLGELQKGRWMPGSDFFRRTEKNQANWPAEEANPNQQIQIAIVYSGNHIAIYRNGRPYVDYDASNRQTFHRDGDVLIGARYRAGAGSETGFFVGDIDEVRLYDRALKANDFKKLVPGKPGDQKPLGMWTFNNGSVDDLMGNFPRGYLQKGATIVDGKLRLNGRGWSMSGLAQPRVDSLQLAAGSPE